MQQGKIQALKTEIAYCIYDRFTVLNYFDICTRSNVSIKLIVTCCSAILVSA